jgi:transposase
MTAEEVDTIQRLAHSRTEPARTVERARVVWLAHQGQRVLAIAQPLGLCQATIRAWRQRFNRQELVGWQEAPWPGRPATYTPAPVSEVIATSLTKPQDLGLPFASWTLDRLAASRQEVKGIPIKCSRIDALVLREGWRWRTPETWFGERGDPTFADKRGSSRRSIPCHRRAVS